MFFIVGQVYTAIKLAGTIPIVLHSVFQTKKAFAILFGVILMFAAITRFVRLSEPSGYYFDEVYHAVTSKLIARNDPRAYEWWNEPPEANTAVDWLHPPLAKYTQAASMLLFGENSFGWRFSSAVFGVFVVAMTGVLAHVAFRRKAITLLATGFIALDGLILAQSRIAMNDIHVTFFILATAAAYLWYRKSPPNPKKTLLRLTGIGILAGLAMSSKWSGVFVLGPIYLFEGLWVLANSKGALDKIFKETLRRGVPLLVVPLLVYVLSYSHMFLQGKTLVCQGDQIIQGQCSCSNTQSFWVSQLQTLFPSERERFAAFEARGGCARLISHFSELHHQIWWYQTNLKATHPYQSRPYQWAFDLRPVWMHVDYTNPQATGNIYNSGNPILFWSGMLAAGLLATLLLNKILKNTSTFLFSGVKKKYLSIPLEQAFLLTLYAIVWMPWMLSPRIMFFYHYAPAVPILAILLAYSLIRLSKSSAMGKLAVVIISGVMLLFFVGLFPLWTGIQMPSSYTQAVFTLFPSWK